MGAAWRGPVRITALRDELFHTSRECRARRCSREAGFSSCAECPATVCEELEKAQSLWDGVPELAAVLSASDFARYAQPYCGHRRRLADLRSGMRRPSGR